MYEWKNDPTIKEMAFVVDCSNTNSFYYKKDKGKIYIDFALKLIFH